MIKSIKETKMALENELEDLKVLRDQIKSQNNFSRRDAEHLDT